MKKKFFYLIILILLSSIFSIIIFNLIKLREEDYLKAEKELTSVTYNTVIEAFRVHSNIIYFNKIDSKYIKEQISKVYTSNTIEKNIIRTNLYNELLDMYENMYEFKLKQLHFHLKNNESFLRFHRPDKHGDNLTEIRATVEYVNKNHKPIYGFEEGRIFNGYRFVYPLEYENKYIGSVETSISMNTIIEEMAKEMKGESDFIIKKDIVEKKVFDEEKNNYISCENIPSFYHEKSVKNGKNPLIETLIHNYSKTKEFKMKLNKGEFFSFFSSYHGSEYIVTFYPIFNAVSKKHVAYIILANNNNHFNSFEAQYEIFLIILLSLLILVTYFIYKINDERAKLKNKEKVLNEVQKIGHLGYWEFNTLNNELVWSDEVYHIFGLDKKYFTPSYKKFLEIIHPSDMNRVDETHKNSIKNKINYEIEYSIITKDGIKYISQDCHHTFDEKGQVRQSLGTIHDITNIKIYQSEIEKNKEQFESLVSNIPDIVYKATIDENLTLKYINESIKTITGYSSIELLSNTETSLVSIIYEEDKEYFRNSIDSMLKQDIENIKLEYRIVTKENVIIWINNFIKLIKEDSNIYIEGIIRDITSQKESYDKLQKFIDAQDNIVILTNGYEINFANNGFFEFFGYENLQAFKEKHKCIYELFVENDRYFYIKDLNNNKNWINTILNIPNSQRIVAMVGKEFTVNAFSVTVNKFEEELYIVTFTDISQTMLKNIELEEKTIHDKLTGAFNREYFDLNYKRLLALHNSETSHFALAVLDIDYFKLVNDNFGHNVGDYVLKEMVKELKKFLSENQTLIRWGGEEFIIILDVISENDLFEKLEKLRTVIEFHYFEKVKKITCSFGATIYKEDEEILKTIKRADSALYSAKANGRNQVKIN